MIHFDVHKMSPKEFIRKFTYKQFNTVSDGVYLVRLDDYKSMVTQWIALMVDSNRW